MQYYTKLTAAEVTLTFINVKMFPNITESWYDCN